MNIYRERMQNVVRALRETRFPRAFKMDRFGHPPPVHDPNGCGTPACALGNYAFRTDLQEDFRMQYGLFIAKGPSLLYVREAVCEHFNITEGEYEELFTMNGCDDARTPARAIAYIEAFIERKWPLPHVVEALEYVTVSEEVDDLGYGTDFIAPELEIA